MLQKAADAGHPVPTVPTLANGGPNHNCHSSEDKSVGSLLRVPHWLGP